MSSKTNRCERQFDVNSYVDLLRAIILDIEALEGIDMAHDIRTISRRAASEGMSFLCKILPSFSKHIFTCVEKGHLTPLMGFKRKRSLRGGPLPAFLHGLVSRIFAEDGCIHESVDPYALGYIDQICGFYKKTEFGYPDTVIAAQCRKYKELDESLPVEDPGVDGETMDILVIAACFAEDLLEDFGITENPRHGPGAVAGGERGFAKYNFCIPIGVGRYFRPSCFFSVKEVRGADREWGCESSPFSDAPLLTLDTLSPYTARVVFVNKDYTKPRTISCEPKELQWLQQAVGRSLMAHLERNPLSRGHINFTDQTVNQSIAQQSSVDLKYATLDLSDASDRLSLWLVREILPKGIFELLNVIRSRYSRLPDSNTVRLRKFAPMGSATTFPVESLIFFALSVAVVAYRYGCDWARAAKKVYVYGDDIIVPIDVADLVVKTLGQLALVVNKDKSFIRSHFRESCGVNAYHGVDITPVRLRKQFPSRRAHTDRLISHIDTSNQLFYAGYWRAAAFLQRLCENVLGKQIQYVPPNSGNFGVTGFEAGYTVMEASRKGRPSIRWNKTLHCLEVRVTRISGHKNVVTDLSNKNQLLAALVRGDERSEWEKTLFPLDKQISVIPDLRKQPSLRTAWKALS